MNTSSKSRYMWVTAVGCFALTLLAFTRNLYLDDAYIHLRIAKNLAELGYFSFNGDSPTYSTSSPLYTGALALLWYIIPQASLPKILNILIYLLLLSLVARLYTRANSPQSSLASLGWMCAIASPMGIRWLADGMESGMTAVMAIALGFLASQISENRSTTTKALPAWIYLVVGCLAVLLRIEFLYVIALMISAWVLRWAIRSARGSLAVAVAPSHGDSVLLLVSGALAAVIIEWKIFGYLLPDTAVAKAASGPPSVSLSSVFGFSVAIGRAHLGSSFFGVVTPVALALSGVALFSTGKCKIFGIVINAGVPIFFALILLRQQMIQGFRYFISIEFFVLAFNLYSLEGNLVRDRQPLNAKRTASIIALVCTLFVWLFYDLERVKVINEGRADGWKRFSTMDLGFLRATKGVAWDVGMIGYFTDGYIVDPNGLVNGRKAAAMSPEARLNAICGRRDIEFVFANEGQLHRIDKCLELSGWREIGRFEFPNFGGRPDTHKLLVHPNTLRAK